MKISTDLAQHLPSGWRLADSADLSAWVARHGCAKCQAAVAFELAIRDRHTRRGAA